MPLYIPANLQPHRQTSIQAPSNSLQYGRTSYTWNMLAASAFEPPTQGLPVRLTNIFPIPTSTPGKDV
ncbi:uncharacterized protein BDW70DRAFT_133691 [Aspergillus foveolatus]|uniref:uncharacterized protein n=1 Tax=Aspergillus foveolatus TaxID=210207 RepID=UPI003CCDAD8B